MKRTYTGLGKSKRPSKKQRTSYTRSNTLARLNAPASLENKFHDIVQVPVGISNTGTIYSLSSTIAQGTSSLQRIGKEIALNTMIFRATARAIDTINSIRMIIFQFNRPGAPVVADVIQDTASVPWLSPINRDNTDFITVLRDNLFTLSLVSNEVEHYKTYIKLKSKAQWNESSVSDKGNIFMLVISDSSVATHPDFSFSSRVRFSG